MNESDPDRLVAAKEMLRCSQRGIRKVDVQPAPRIRMSTDIYDLMWK